MFPGSDVQHIITEESHHQTLVVRVLLVLVGSMQRVQRPFQYAVAWTRHEQYEEMVTSAWGEAHAANHEQVGLGAACIKHAQLSKAMHAWSRSVFRSIKRQIDHLKSQLRDAKERAASIGYKQEIKDIEDQLHELYEREEV